MRKQNSTVTADLLMQAVSSSINSCCIFSDQAIRIQIHYAVFQSHQTIVIKARLFLRAIAKAGCLALTSFFTTRRTSEAQLTKYSLPQTYMFVEMRSMLGISKGTDILAHIGSLPPDEQESAMKKIREIEHTAMAAQLPQPGLVQLMAYLESKTIPKGICTRNFDTPVNHLLSKFLAGRSFSPIVTRDFKPPKPDPAGILYIARTWGFEDARDMIMVG